MRTRLFGLFFLHLIHAQSQTDLGLGLVSIDFDDKTVLEFFPDTLATSPVKVISFFDDSTINSWNIKDLKKHQEWLRPEVLWLDYSAFTFRCSQQTTGWVQVIVNNETGLSLWLKRTPPVQFRNWETYLKEMFGVARLPEYPQPLRSAPTENSQAIAYEGEDCFIVKSMHGYWIEIASPDYCDDLLLLEKSGWIKWRNKNELLITYYTTS